MSVSAPLKCSDDGRVRLRRGRAARHERPIVAEIGATQRQAPPPTVLVSLAQYSFLVTYDGSDPCQRNRE